jgi:hypothetical protein
VVLGGLLEIELLQDAADVGLDRLQAEEQGLGDAAVRVALRHELEDRPLALGEPRERIVGTGAVDELLDDLGVDDRSARRDRLDGAHERLRLGDALLQQVPGAAAGPHDAQGVLGRRVHREEQHADLRPARAHLLERDDALVPEARRHADVEDRGVEIEVVDHLEELLAGADRCDDLDAAALEHLRDALTQQQRVICDSDAQGDGRICHRTSVQRARAIAGRSPRMTRLYRVSEAHLLPLSGVTLMRSAP